MSIIQAAGAGEAATAFYPFEISNSLFFDSANSAVITRTNGTATNGKKCTLSFWVKKSEIASGTPDPVPRFIQAFSGTGNQFHAQWGDGTTSPGNQWQVSPGEQASNQGLRMTDSSLRDPAAWYHCLWSYNSESGSESVVLYVNGNPQTSSTYTDAPTTNLVTSLTKSGVEIKIGFINSSSPDLYLAECTCVDGQALTPSSFGETKENIWIPKDTSGLAFGDNGFRLQFKNSSVGSGSSRTVGGDTSGNNNHFSSTNVASTDVTTDSPTDNHATMNPLDGVGVFSDGNLRYVSTQDPTTSTIGISSGSFFAEVTVVANNNSFIGIVDIGVGLAPDRGGGWTSHGAVAYKHTGDQYSLPVGGSSATTSYGQSYTDGDVIGIAVDVDADTVTFFKNGSTQGNTTYGPSHISSGGVYGLFVYGNDSTFTVNFGQLSFAHTAPSGFAKLSTANLPSPAIDPAQGENPTEYFNTLIETGNTATSRAFTGAGFQPDWLWSKSRTASRSHALFDSVRGVTKYLAADSPAAELSSPSSGFLSSFDADGFTATQGSSNFQNLNNNNEKYVYWLWKAGGAPSADNSAGVGATPTAGSVKIDGANLGSALAGTIAATRLSASTEAGFSVTIYTGNGNNNATVAHGLNAVPEWVFTKARNNGTDNWAVFHSGLTNIEHFIELNLSGGQTSGNTRFGTNAPTSSVMNLGYAGSTNTNLMTYVMYAFAPKEGFSKFGIYDDSVVGSDYENTSPFVYTGFRPAWLMIKGTSNGRDWVMYDNKRTPDDGVYLRANEPDTEQTDATNHDISFLSNGFKIRGGSGDINTTAESYIYMAFADQPLKFANGGTE